VTAALGRLALIVAKSVGLYAMALVAFRLMGKRCLGDMEPLDFVVVLAIAEIVGAPLADPDLPVAPAVVAVVTLTVLQIVLSLVNLSSPRVESLLEGKPIVVVKEGRILKRNLRRARVTPAELAERLRERGFLGPEDVEMAVFETDGMLSAIPKKEAAPLTPRFLGLKASTVLFLAGKPVPEGLERVGLDARVLERWLRRRGLNPADVDEVLLDPRGRLRVTVRLEAGDGGGPAARGSGGRNRRDNTRGRPEG